MVASTAEEPLYPAEVGGRGHGEATAVAAGASLGGAPNSSLARAFVLDANNEWATVATGVAAAELSEDGRTLTVSLHEEGASHAVLFSTTFHKEHEISRQQGTPVWEARQAAFMPFHLFAS